MPPSRGDRIADLDDHRRLVAGLGKLLSQRQGPVEVVETHGASVLLAGDRVYKIKKPVDLGFLDYSTLARRQRYCNEELRLNQRHAPALYLRVVNLTGYPDQPTIDGSGPVLDVAVEMARFASGQRLDRVLARGELGVESIVRLATAIADNHAQAPVLSPDQPLADPQAQLAPIRANLADCQRILPASTLLDGLLVWTEERLQLLSGWVAERLQAGAVRECHGDLHLANLYQDADGIHPFDGIEFDPALRWIDVLNDLAFLLMDLDRHGAGRWSNLLLSLYLERTGDYPGLVGLRLFQCYRAMVRAKVAALSSPDGQQGSAMDYLRLADRYTRTVSPRLWQMGGLSGSGKSTRALELVMEQGCLRIRSDVERKRLYGIDPGQSAQAAPGEGLYGPEAGRRTYDRLLQLADTCLSAGWSVVIDAASLRRGERQRMQALARFRGCPWTLLWCDAEPSELRRRIRQRALQGQDPSDATEAVLERQLTLVEWPTADELGAADV